VAEEYRLAMQKTFAARSQVVLPINILSRPLGAVAFSAEPARAPGSDTHVREA